MRPFSYSRAADARTAVRLADQPAARDAPPTSAPVQFLAGGTNIVDFMKLGSWQADALVDVNDLEREHGAITAGADGLRLGALVRMSQAADDPVINRDYPVIAQSLRLAASAQLRNMASLGGNVLQRTRCTYFRNTDYAQCNKRVPGSGCAAIGGNNRTHAVLGVSDRCISNYPGDFAQALAALDARVETLGPAGRRTLRFEELHTGPERPERETVLMPGELITGFVVPAGPHTRRSHYLKIRDRQSYEYGLATAAVALDLAPDGAVRDARIAMAGVAYRPYRAHAAEALLKGRRLDAAAAEAAGTAAMQGAVTHGGNDYKPALGRRTVARALLHAARMEA
ncbi:MAG: FAD binding domain-containing protein [Caulobacteraceae bacterium]|nr:FAD binding domain-containing protein [Caulobacter sp.]